MFTIDKEHLDNRSARQDMPPLTPTDVDATQRLPMDNVRAPRSRPTAPRSGAAAAQQRRKKEKERRTLIILICAAAVLLIGIVIAALAIFSPPQDSDAILKNVYAAGVDLGGMTKEEAAQALHNATDQTYSKLDMTVTVLDSTLILSPDMTGASLDVDAVVEAAYNYGRTGSRSEQQQARKQALSSQYHIPITSYLNLDADYIRSQLTELGQKYSTVLTQSSYEISGERPSMDLEDKDTSVTYQTLTLHIGTAEYGLSTEKLYGQILDAYNSNLFQVTGECSVNAPTPLNLDEIFSLYCTAPQNAELIDPENYQIKPEVYGYGFDLSTVKIMVSDASYGSTLQIPLKFLRPDITAEELSGEAFKDILASFSTPVSANGDYNRNLMIAASKLNNHIIRPDETFSFNSVIGSPSTTDGYKSVKVYVGKEYKDVVGGGISQLASTLYYCALVSDLEIVERTNHYYVPGYCDKGLDAEVSYGNLDLRFKNTTGQPIRIEATVTDTHLEIVLVGTASTEYRVEIQTEIVRTYDPITTYITLPANNAGQYADGAVLVQGFAGYVVNTYRCAYRLPSEGTDAPTEMVSRDLLTSSYYEKQNTVVVKIASAEEPVDPGIPTPPEGGDPGVTP